MRLVLKEQLKILSVRFLNQILKSKICDEQKQREMKPTS